MSSRSSRGFRALLACVFIVPAAVALPAGANEAVGIGTDELQALGVETDLRAWLPPTIAAIESTSWTMELTALRGAGKLRDVVVVLATLRRFDDEEGERRERVLRVHVVDRGEARLFREYRLGDPDLYVRLVDVGDLDGDEAAEVVLSYGAGGSTAGFTVEVLDPFASTPRPGCTTRSDEAVALVDADGDGILEVVVAHFVAGRASPRCNAERVCLEDVLAYREGSLRRVGVGAAEFFRRRAVHVEAIIAAASSDRAGSSYFLEAQAARAAALRARAAGR